MAIPITDDPMTLEPVNRNVATVRFRQYTMARDHDTRPRPRSSMQTILANRKRPIPAYG
jgi:hypothetical protein